MPPSFLTSVSTLSVRRSTFTVNPLSFWTLFGLNATFPNSQEVRRAHESDCL
jgi:hypothetical protein